MLEQIKAGTLEIMGIKIEEGDVEVKRVERPGFAASTIQVGQGDDAYHVSLVLDMNDTPELLSKGLARDITRRIQAKRKDLNLNIEANIELEIWLVNAPELYQTDKDWIVSETRASVAVFHPAEDSTSGETESFETMVLKFSSLSDKYCQTTDSNISNLSSYYAKSSSNHTTVLLNTDGGLL